MSFDSQFEVVDEEGNVTRWIKKNGLVFVGLSTDESIDAIEHFNVREDDVWVCMFPKSGGHWVFEIAEMLLRKRSELSHLEMHQYNLEFADNRLSEMASPRVIHTHLPWDMLPKDVWRLNCKVVYVYRNPKDIIVSLYWFMKTSPFFNNYPGSFGAFLRTNLVQDIWYRGWYHNVTGWMKSYSTKMNVLFMSYEQLHHNPVDGIRKLAEFLELERNKDECKNIAEKTSMENMKTHKVNTIPFRLYRKGGIGNWKMYFTVEENEMFDKVHQERMQDIDCVVEFE